MKGIILAGGKGSRLYPATAVVSKPLLIIYDKPMIYYPLSTLMQAGIRDILLITSAPDLNHYHELLGDGHQLGINLSYAIQHKPIGIPDAFTIGKSFIGNDNIVLILGDNIFYGEDFITPLITAGSKHEGALIFAYLVPDPQRYGVVELDDNGYPIEIIEKPQHPKSGYAVTGLYVYDNEVVDIAPSLPLSARGEQEITDINKYYLNKNKLKVAVISRGNAWLDTGTQDSLLDAALYVRVMEKRQYLKIACPEEIAYRKGFINDEQLAALCKPLMNSTYGHYLHDLMKKKWDKAIK